MPPGIGEAPKDLNRSTVSETSQTGSK